MAEHSAIEWTDATWNPVTGCSKVSPGCANCYAETISLRFGTSKLPWTPENAAENVVLHPDRLDQPLRWRKPRMVFVNSMSDLFHEEVPDIFIGRVFNIMAGANRHTFQVLTKRPERARDFLLGFYEHLYREPTYEPIANVWLGVSIENARYTWRADVLREIPAAVRFISAEPLLGSLFEQPREHDVVETVPNGYGGDTYAVRGRKPLDLSGIDWLIAGGESGPKHRPVNLDHVRELRDACLAECGEGCRGDVHAEPCDSRPAFFFKQVGGRTPKSGGRLLDGREWNEMPNG